MLRRDVLLTEDNEKIAYKWYKNNHDKVVVIAPGFFNSKDSVLLTELAEHLSRKRDVFIFDYRGHGESTGLFTWTSKERIDLERVLEHIKDEYKSISIIGFSMGASVAINTLAGNKYKVDSFVCVSAPSNCSKIDFKWWKLSIENDIVYSLLTRSGRKGKGVRPGPFWLAKEKPIDNVGKLTMPVLYIHGDKDWVVDKAHSVKLYDRTNAPKKIVIMKGGPHAEYLMRRHRSELLSEIDEWLSNVQVSKINGDGPQKKCKPN